MVTQGRLCAQYLLHGNSGRHSSGQLNSPSTLHQLNGLFHLHLVVEGDELWLLGAFTCNQALLHILLVEAVQPERRKGVTDENSGQGQKTDNGVRLGQREM